MTEAPTAPVDHHAQPSPAEGLRLVQAFLAVSDPVERAMILEHVERAAARSRAKTR